LKTVSTVFLEAVETAADEWWLLITSLKRGVNKMIRESLMNKGLGDRTKFRWRSYEIVLAFFRK
jgi:hypothetical protein